MRKFKSSSIIITFCLVLIGCIVVGRITAHSYHDNLNFEDYGNKDGYRVSYCGMEYASDEDFGFQSDENIESLENLQDGDVVIIKAKLAKSRERKLYYESVLSYVEVLECYQGGLKMGDEIAFFEAVDCTENVMYATDGYAPIQENTSYLLFLQPLKNTFFGKDRYVYRLVNLTYGKFTLRNNMPVCYKEEQLEEGEGELLLYAENQNADVFLYEEKNYKKYCKLKKQVLEKYGWEEE